MASTDQITVSTEAPDLREGLEARIHDPLWMLARQWQLGEFLGEDVGSPVAAVVRYEAAPLTRYRPGPAAAAKPVQSYSPRALPLETAVEREPIVTDAAPNWRASAEAGQHLLRMLNAEGLGNLRPKLLQSAYRLPSPTAEQVLDGDSRAFLGVVGGRVVDGARLHGRMHLLSAAGHLPDLLKEAPFDGVADEDDRKKLMRVLAAWLAWYANRFALAAGESTSWVSERIEYEFAVAAAMTDGEVVLAAPEYQEGHLDWYSFAGQAGASLGAAPDSATVTKAFLPTPVSYPGMPSPRFWEFEDGRVNFAKLEARPEDVARQLLVRFAVEFGNDWFVVPLELDAGSLCRVRTLTVTNSFGEQLLVPHTIEVDGPLSPWRAFALSQAAPQLFFLPPALGLSLHGSPIEDVHFLRDEMANVAWAVERVVQSQTGRPLDRFEAYQQARERQDQAAPVANSGQFGAAVSYRLGSTVPDYWIPLLPVQEGTAVRLKRGALPKLDADAIIGVLEPLGRILEPGRDLLLHDEEVPREGARVTRSYQYARWIDGSTHFWVGRRKQPGRGEGSSGLRFDFLESNPNQNL